MKPVVMPGAPSRIPSKVAATPVALTTPPAICQSVTPVQLELPDKATMFLTSSVESLTVVRSPDDGSETHLERDSANTVVDVSVRSAQFPRSVSNKFTRK